MNDEQVKKQVLEEMRLINDDCSVEKVIAEQATDLTIRLMKSRQSGELAKQVAYIEELEKTIDGMKEEHEKDDKYCASLYARELQNLKAEHEKELFCWVCSNKVTTKELLCDDCYKRNIEGFKKTERLKLKAEQNNFDKIYASRKAEFESGIRVERERMQIELPERLGKVVDEWFEHERTGWKSFTSNEDLKKELKQKLSDEVRKDV